MRVSRKHPLLHTFSKLNSLQYEKNSPYLASFFHAWTALKMNDFVSYLLLIATEKIRIADGFFVLLVLISFAAWRKGKLQTWSLTLIWCVLIWFSNPVVFLQAGCLLVELFCALKEKKWTQFRQLFLVGVCILSCFVFYYLFWLRSVAVSDYMQGYWQNDNFPLIPTSRKDLNRFIDCINKLFNGFARCKWAIIVLVTAVSWHSFCSRKNKALLYIIVATIVALGASWAHFYPIKDRLWVFFIPLMAAFCLSGLEELGETEGVATFIALIAIALRGVLRTERWDVVIVLLICLVGAELIRRKERFDTTKIVKAAQVVIPMALVLIGGGIQHYWGHPENVYWPDQELNDEILYLQKNIQADENVYVHFWSIYGWQYKLGYDNKSIGGYDENVVYGAVPFYDRENGKGEIAVVLEYDKLYVAASHDTFRNLERLGEVQKEGQLELVSYEHETPLWFFCKDLADSKIEASWEITKRDGDEFTVRIHNVGPAWLNHEYENVYLLDTVSGAKTALPKLVAPEKVIELKIKCANEPEFMLMNDEGPICTERTFHHE